MADDGEESAWESGPGRHLEGHNYGAGTFYLAGRDQHITYPRGTRRTVAGGPPPECPYPGLSPFRPDEAQWFFGRDELVAGLIGRLDRRRTSGGIQMVLGPSGAGKSSLLGAGLVPRLKRSGLPGSGTWPRVFLTPTAKPLDVLSSRLAAETGLDQATLHQRLLANSQGGLDGLIKDLRAIVRAKNPAARLVVIVDQFEELFEGCEDEVQRRTFLDFLVRAADGSADREPLSLTIVGVRADLYEQLSNRPQLRTALEDSPLIVGSLSEAQLLDAIVNPALDVGLELESGLVEVLLGDLGAEAGPELDAPVRYETGRLPFLAHALRGICLASEGSTMTIKGYQNTGGIRNAIATTADNIFRSLSDNEKLLAEAMFLRLTKVSADSDATRRRLTLQELTGSFTEPAAAALVMNAFVDARLLTRQHDTVQITHDVLLRSWPELIQWLKKDPSGHLIRQEIEGAATAWDREGHEPSRLYRGNTFQVALKWATETTGEQTDQGTEGVGHEPAASRYRFELSPTGAQFLDSSVRHERRIKKLRRVLVASVALLVVVASIAGLVAWQANLAKEQQLHTQASHMLGRASRDEAEPVRSLQLALAAWHNDSGTQEAYESLFRRYLAMGSVDHIDYDQGGGVKLAGWVTSADGRTAVQRNEKSDGGVRLLVRSGLLGPAPSTRTIAEGRLGPSAISDDGTMIAFVDESGFLSLWTDGGGAQRVTTAGATCPYRPKADNIRLSSDHRYLLLWARSRADLNPTLPTPLVVLDLAARRVVYQQEKNLPVGFEATFGVEPDTLVTVVPESSVIDIAEPEPIKGEVIRISTGEKIHDLPAGAVVAQRGQTVVTCEWGYTVHVFDTATGAERFAIPALPCRKMVLDGTSRYLFALSGDINDPYRVGIAVDLVTRKHYRFRAPVSPATDAFVATAAQDRNGDLLIRQTAGTSVVTLRAPEVAVRPVSWGQHDPNDRYALQIDSERNQLVSLVDGSVLGAQPGDFGSAGFTADGKHIIALRGSDIAVFDTPDFTPRRTIRLPAGAPPCPTDRVVLLTPQGSELALSCGPLLYRWDAASGAPLGEPVQFGTRPDVIEVRPGHEHQVVTTQGDLLRIWDVERQSIVKSIPLGFRAGNYTTKVAVLDDTGSRIAIASYEASLSVWDLDAESKIAGPVPGTSMGHLVGFGLDGTVITQAGADVTVWDFVRGFVSTARTPSESGSDDNVKVHADTLVIDTSVTPFEMTSNPDTWFRQLCRVVGRPLAPEDVTNISPGALSDLPCL